MDIVIDLTSITAFFSQPIDVILGKILFYFGWIPVAFVFLGGTLKLWVLYRQNKWVEKNVTYTLLAIDVPRGNEQTPKAVENFMSYLGGAHGTLNLLDIYWEGKVQLSFSLEIISLEGYTQFLIRTPSKNRDLVESGIYSQYPDAEITEVDDYVEQFKDIRFPNDEWNLWGAEFIQSANEAYPIRTYKEFEHLIGPPGTQFKDPMASLMDMCSSMKKGENFLMQLIVRPIGFDWMDRLDQEANKILKEKLKFKKNIFAKALDVLLAGISVVASDIMGTAEAVPADDKQDDPLKMMQLKPKEKKRVEGIHEKTSKLGFDFKIRMAYLAKNDIFNASKGAGGFVGFIKQFTANDLNGLMPDMDRTATSTAYFFSKRHMANKKNRILQNYIKRDIAAGRDAKIMNIEELATIWHFPHEGVVKAPMIQKTPGKKAEAPMSLPKSEEIVGEERARPIFLEEEEETDEKIKEAPVISEVEEEPVIEDVNKKNAPPGNLPLGE